MLQKFINNDGKYSKDYNVIQKRGQFKNCIASLLKVKHSPLKRTAASYKQDLQQRKDSLCHSRGRLYTRVLHVLNFFTYYAQILTYYAGIIPLCF